MVQSPIVTTDRRLAALAGVGLGLLAIFFPLAAFGCWFVLSAVEGILIQRRAVVLSNQSGIAHGYDLLGGPLLALLLGLLIGVCGSGARYVFGI